MQAIVQDLKKAADVVRGVVSVQSDPETTGLVHDMDVFLPQSLVDTRTLLVLECHNARG